MTQEIRSSKTSASKPQTRLLLTIRANIRIHKYIKIHPDHTVKLPGINQAVINTQSSSEVYALQWPFNYMIAPWVFHVAITLPLF